MSNGQAQSNIFFKMIESEKTDREREKKKRLNEIEIGMAQPGLSWSVTHGRSLNCIVHRNQKESSTFGFAGPTMTESIIKKYPVLKIRLTKFDE